MEKIKATTRNLDAILAEIPDDRRAIGEEVVKELRFLQRVLAQLKKVIEERGVVEPFRKGRKTFLRESPAVKAYNTALTKFSLLYKQLEDLLPKSDYNNNNELIDFIQAPNSVSK